MPNGDELLNQANTGGYNPIFDEPRERIVLRRLLKEYPALSNVYNPKDVRIQLANKKRMQQLESVGGGDRGMETWFPDDPGTEDLPHPMAGKNKWVFEYYDKNAYKDKEIFKSSLMLDMIHGAKKDYAFNRMRQDFNANWSPKTYEFLQKKYEKDKNEGETFASYVDRTGIDAFLRGGLNPINDEYLQTGKYNDQYAQYYRGQVKEIDGTPIDIYSPKQREIIDNMKTYLTTNQNPYEYDKDYITQLSKDKPYTNITELRPHQEKKFQQWVKTLPENLQSDTEEYDLRGAYQANMKPVWDEESESYHLSSRDPKTGKLLKNITHGTFDKLIEGEKAAGYEIYYDDKENRYYSRKKKTKRH
jgi:hypothetical protein